MDDKVLFGNTLNMATQALNLRSRKHDMIASNLANADTPGFKAFDLLVEESLQNQNGSAANLQLKITHPGHRPAGRAAGSGVNPKIIRTPEPNNLRGDGNTVDMDREMSNLAANQLLYRASAHIVAQKFQGIKNVINGGQ